jgi:hypothetical protein
MGLTQTNEVKRLSKVTPPLPPTQDGLEVIQRIVDRAVRGSRDQYWCERLEDMLKLVVPEMAASDGHFYATDDKDCRSATIGAAEAYGPNGYSARGYDRDGFDRYGNPSSGFMPNGFGRSFNRDGYDEFGYNSDGYDKNGHRRKGRDATPEEMEAGKQLVNPTTAILGPDGKLYRKGTVFDHLGNVGQVKEKTSPTPAPRKRAPRKATAPALLVA